MQSQTKKITKRTVDALPLPTTGESRLWDTEVKGFCVRVYPTGRKAYAVRYRRGKAQRIHTIGRHGSPPTFTNERIQTLIFTTMILGSILGFGLAFWLQRQEADPSVLDALKLGVVFAGGATAVLYFAAGLLVGFPGPPSGGGPEDVYENVHPDRAR